MKRIHLIKLTPLHDREKKTSLQIRYRSSIPPNYKGDDILIAKEEKKKAFPLRSETRQRCPILPLLIQYWNI